ncbi:MAG: glycosyl transferase [Deltaproteobacteria bacterium RBG_13_58_19]|nr:MAG: glycosyl transferase [Deltaproteobacteria bacterium RBG_13_58_19]
MIKKNLEFFEKVAPIRDEWKRKNKYYWQSIENFCAFLVPENARILEVGCSTGDLIATIKASRKVGLDYSPRMIQIAKSKYKDIEFHVMEAESLQLEEKFDYVIISNTIGYLEDIQRVFSEIKKVCHENTKVIVTYYNFLWQPLLGLAEALGLRMEQPYQNWLSSADIKNLLYLADFDPFKSGERQIIPIYIPILSDLLNRYVAKLPLFRKLCITNYIIAKPLTRTGPEEYKKAYSVSVIIPARNEAGNIEDAVLRLPPMGQETEIIFIEGHSTDNTWEKIQEIYEKYKDRRKIKIAQQDGKGKGDAVRKGFDLASGDILMILDADLTVPPEDLPKFYDALASGRGEFINGSRLVYNMDKKAMRFLNLLGNKIFSLMFSWLLDQRLKDTLCGTKVLFKNDYGNIRQGRKYFGDFDPFGDFDLLFGAAKLNLKIIDLPICYRQRTYGTTNIQRWRHGWLLLKMVIFAARRIKFV